MGQATSSIKEYATVAFTLLGVLFGMMIMTFIFGQLGNASTDTLNDESFSIVNRTGAYINSSNYKIPEALTNSFNGGFSVSAAYNYTNGSIIPSSAYTVNAAAGTITNKTVIKWNNVTLSYSYSSKTSAKLGTEAVQNNSLQGIVAYTDNSSTQFNTVSIAIILVLLIGVFLVFWKIFVSNKQKREANNMGGNFA